MGVLTIKDKSLYDNTEIELMMNENELYELITKLNGFKLNPSKNIDETIKKLHQLIEREFIIATKL